MSDELTKLAAAITKTTAVLASMEAARIADREQAAASRSADDAATRKQMDDLTAQLNAALDAAAPAPAPHAADPSAPTGVERMPTAG